MTQANVARRHGDDFQGRFFWLKASSLLDPQSPIVEVSYETGPKSFDDIQIEFDRQRAPTDYLGRPIYRKHFQCKWHTSAGAFGYADLVDPNFINAQRFSLLQRAHQAQIQHAPDGVGSQFVFVTNWRIRADDQLLQLVRKSSDALDLHSLFDGTTDRSRMGQVRKSWCESLGVDHAGLRAVARTLAIAETTESLDDVRERLDERFAAVRMKRVAASESAFIYDDLIMKLLAQGRVKFNRDSFAKMVRKEGLLDEQATPEQILTIGVRSFMHPIDNLEDRCSVILNLLPYFEGRYVRNRGDWQDRIFPELQEFVLKAARSTDRLRMILDAHASLAFAAGAMLNVKSGKWIQLEQRTGGRHFWSMDDVPVSPNWQKLTIDEEIVDPVRSEIAVAISLTHDVSPSVSRFVRQEVIGVGRILHCKLPGGPSQQSLSCGHHAWVVSETLVNHLQLLRDQGSRNSLVHVFLAGPNSFAFFLGQQQQTIGPAALYEWDFEGERGGGYSLALTVGPVRAR